MSSSSSASSRFTNRRSINGVPSRCWCGRKLVTYAAQTKENPFRRFYRCEVALQMKTEDHLFKWIEEALLDETKMVEAKHFRLVEEVKELRKNLVESLEVQNTMIRKMEEAVKTKVDEKMKEELMMANATMEKMARDMAKVCVQKVGVTMVVVGILGWICGKLMS